MIPTREALLAKAASVPAPPVAIEAFWDGDTTGWYVVLTLLYAADPPTEPPYREHELASMRGDGGDFRLFRGQVPPWPEAVRAIEVGSELAAGLGIPFFFASPDHPEDSCPRWWEQSQGYPCRRCGIPLLEREPFPRRGICGHCSAEETSAKREAAWSPEERAGPRCAICGSPASSVAGGLVRCRQCLDRYDDYVCSRCGGHVTTSKTLAHTDICSTCELAAKLAAVSDADRQVIREVAAARGHLHGVREARRILGCSLYDAIAAVNEICGHD